MPKTTSIDWTDAIRVVITPARNKKGYDRAVCTCPVFGCSRQLSADILNDTGSGPATVKSDMMLHVRKMHPEYITDAEQSVEDKPADTSDFGDTGNSG